MVCVCYFHFLPVYGIVLSSAEMGGACFCSFFIGVSWFCISNWYVVIPKPAVYILSLFLFRILSAGCACGKDRAYEMGKGSSGFVPFGSCCILYCKAGYGISFAACIEGKDSLCKMDIFSSCMCRPAPVMVWLQRPV